MKKKYKKEYINKISKKEKGLILEVVRFDNLGNGYKKSIPCKNCQENINKCIQIKTVFHS